MSRVWPAAFLFAACVFDAALAQSADSSMKFKIVAFPPDQIKSVIIGGASGDQDIKLDEKNEAEVPLSEAAWSKSALAIVWKDDSTTSFPVRVSSAFSRRSVEVHLHKSYSPPPNVTDPTLACVEEPGQTIREKFKMLTDCRHLAKAQVALDKEYLPAHLRALSGWLRASFALYNQEPAGPYGVDPDLVTAMEGVIYKVDIEKYREVTFRPLRVADVRQFSGLIADEEIRAGGHVPTLAAAGRWNDARRLNDFVKASFDNISTERNVSKVRGLNKEWFEKNEKWIESKRSQ
jgi:hypothetical protein